MGAGWMVFVVVVNGLVALGLLWGAWRLWGLRRDLAQVTQLLTEVEEQLRGALRQAPEAILQGQMGVLQVRSLYTDQLLTQLQRVRQGLAVLSFAVSMWRRGGLGIGRSPHPRRQRRRR